MGKAIALATPVFFLLIGIELLVARWRGARGIYRFNDAINSLSLGVLSQVTSLFMRGLAIGIYVIVFEHVALGTWPRDAWWAWALAIVFYDFCYYWNHRLGHESAMFWASHVVHHQSQRYNLSTTSVSVAAKCFSTTRRPHARCDSRWDARPAVTPAHPDRCKWPPCRRCTHLPYSTEHRSCSSSAF